MKDVLNISNDGIIMLDGVYHFAGATGLATALTTNTEKIEVVLLKDISLPMSSLGSQTPGSGEYKLGGEDTKSIVIDLNGYELTLTTTYMTAIGAKNNDATITIKNGSMNGNGNNSTTWNIYDLIFANCNYEFEDVTFNKEVALTNTGKNVKMNNVEINGTGDFYALWISAEGQNVTIDGLTVNSQGRGIKIDEQYSNEDVAKVTLKVSNADFNTAKKAAIIVKSAQGADITVNNVDISKVAADTVYTVWVDEDAAQYADLVNVSGGMVISEAYVITDGLYTDANGDFYTYNANGLQSLKNWMDSKANKDFWGKTYNIMADIDASTVVWNTKSLSPDSSYANGIVFNGNGYTISNLTITGQGLFTGATKGGNGSKVSTFKDITFDNVTVTGGSHHNGVIWGEAYGSLTLEKVSVINSKVSGGCNVGGLIGRNSESHATFTFIDCAVKNTTVEATKKADNVGASAFLGMALHIGNSCSANVVFEGTNVAEGNTLTTADGMQGGGIYTKATWDAATWDTPIVVTTFTNYNSNN